jgi:hypothetical protein
MPLSEFVHRSRRTNAADFGLTLSYDPGITTGWCLFRELDLLDAGQFAGLDFVHYQEMESRYKPAQVVCENYRVYAHRAAQHVGSDVPVAQILGVIKYVCLVTGTPLHLQMAFQAKGFVTDQRLRMLGLFREGQPHATDAIRHTVYWFLFGKR